MKKCRKCNLNKEFSEFNFKNKTKNTFQSYCKLCSRILIKNHYNSRRGYYLEKAKKRNLTLRMILVEYVNNFLELNHCVDCGESDKRVLEFDHINKSQKLKAVSNLIRDRVPLNIIKIEMAKCEVRCANCHRKKTANDFNWFKNNSHL